MRTQVTASNSPNGRRAFGAVALWRELKVGEPPGDPALTIPLEEIDSLPEAMRVPPEGGGGPQYNGM